MNTGGVRRPPPTPPPRLRAAFFYTWKRWIDKGFVTPHEAQQVFDILSSLRPSFEGSTLVPPLLNMTEPQLDSIMGIMAQIEEKIKGHNSEAPAKEKLREKQTNAVVIPGAFYQHWFELCADASEETPVEALGNRTLGCALRETIASSSTPLYAYFNFKSHMIFTQHTLLEEMLLRAFGEEGLSNLRILGMGEALVPVELAEKMKENSYVDLAELEAGTVQQPFGDQPNAQGFSDFKKEKNLKSDVPTIDKATGIQRDASFWLGLFRETLGFKYAVFGNPSSCPWGENWGNLVLLREKPRSAQVIQLAMASKKRFFFGSSADENRSMIKVVLDDGTVFCSTHLEDRDADLRQKQAEQITEVLSLCNKSQRTILVGDLNEVYLPSYNDHEKRILQAFNFQGNPLPTASLQYMVEKSVGKVLTDTIKHESTFNKNVCHWVVSCPDSTGEISGAVFPFYAKVGDHTMTVVALP